MTGQTTARFRLACCAVWEGEEDGEEEEGRGDDGIFLETHPPVHVLSPHSGIERCCASASAALNDGPRCKECRMTFSSGLYRHQGSRIPTMCYLLVTIREWSGARIQRAGWRFTHNTSPGQGWVYNHRVPDPKCDNLVMMCVTEGHACA